MIDIDQAKQIMVMARLVVRLARYVSGLVTEKYLRSTIKENNTCRVNGSSTCITDHNPLSNHSRVLLMNIGRISGIFAHYLCLLLLPLIEPL